MDNAVDRGLDWVGLSRTATAAQSLWYYPRSSCVQNTGSVPTLT